MAWPFDEAVRPYMRTATWFLRQGHSPAEIMDWARSSHAHYNLAFMEQAIPEAQRAVYFANRVQQVVDRVGTGGRDMRLSQLWGLSARAAWYAGYGRAPTDAERMWAYTRPSPVIGVAFEVVGRGAHTGRFQHYTVTVNVSWDTRVGELADLIRQMVISGEAFSGDMGSEPLRADSLTMSIVQGSLLELQEPTIRGIVIPGG